MDQEEASGPTLPHSTFGCNIMVKLKVCWFIPYFYVSLNSKNPCSIWCTLFMYIYIYIYIYFFFFKFKKNSRFPNLSQKKRKIFKKKKSLWTRGVEPLSHLKKKKKKSLKEKNGSFLKKITRKSNAPSSKKFFFKWLKGSIPLVQRLFFWKIFLFFWENFGKLEFFFYFFFVLFF